MTRLFSSLLALPFALADIALCQTAPAATVPLRVIRRPTNSFTAEDMRVWQAFEGFAWRTAKANGVTLSRSEGIFFVPGESFRIEEGRIMLRYFRAFRGLKVGNTGMSEFAAVEIGTSASLQNSPTRRFSGRGQAAPLNSTLEG